MPTHDLARTPPAANKAKPAAADRSRDRTEVRLEHMGNAHSSEHHRSILTTRSNMATTTGPVHSGAAGRYPRPTSGRRPEGIRAAGYKKHQGKSTKASGCTAGSCVIRASCFVLRADCWLRAAWPRCPRPQIRPDRGSIPVPLASESDYVAHSAIIPELLHRAKKASNTLDPKKTHACQP